MASRVVPRRVSDSSSARSASGKLPQTIRYQHGRRLQSFRSVTYICIIEKIRVSRLAAMAADCKSAGFTIVGSSPTWPTKRNRAASLWKPPNINIIPHLFSPVHSQFLQLFASILMEHPILQFSRSGCIMKIQKRSESNVLSKLPINKIYRK